MNEALQTSTLPATVTLESGDDCRTDTGEIVSAEDVLKYRHQMYVDWTASSGLRVEEDGDFTVVTATEFAQMIGVHRTTIYNWPKQIPNFQERVAKRRAEINAGNAVNAVWKGVKLAAMGGDTRAADMFLRNFDGGYKAANVKPEANQDQSVAGLMQAALDAGIIEEGELVD